MAVISRSRNRKVYHASCNLPERCRSAARLGVIQDDLVVDVAWLGESVGVDLPETMLDLIDLGRVGVDRLRDCLDDCGAVLPLEPLFRWSM